MPAEKDAHLSFEERKIKAWISRAQRELDRKEKQMEYLERMSGKIPELRPAYHGHGHTPSYAHKAQRLRQQMDQIKTATIDKTSALLKYSSPENRQKGNGLLVAFLYRGEMAKRDLRRPKDINQSQAIAMKMRYGRKNNNPMEEKKTEKTLDASQEYAMKLMGDYRESRGKTPEKEKASVKDLDASQAYAMKLRYGYEEPGKGKAAAQEKGGKKDIDASQAYAQKLMEAQKERQQPGEEKEDKGAAQKSMSMSASFSQRLNSSISIEQDETGREGMDMER